VETLVDTNTATILQASAQRLFPNANLSRVLAELLLERARKT